VSRNGKGGRRENVTNRIVVLLALAYYVRSELWRCTLDFSTLIAVICTVDSSEA